MTNQIGAEVRLNGDGSPLLAARGGDVPAAGSELNNRGGSVSGGDGGLSDGGGGGSDGDGVLAGLSVLVREVLVAGGEGPFLRRVAVGGVGGLQAEEASEPFGGLAHVM